MAEYKQLRIGSWIKWADPKFTYWQVQESDLMDDQFKDALDKFIHPIPLNAENLSRLGFDGQGRRLVILKDGTQSTLQCILYQAHLIDENGLSTKNYGAISSVHELQNLFVEITGSELEIPNLDDLHN